MRPRAFSENTVIGCGARCDRGPGDWRRLRTNGRVAAALACALAFACADAPTRPPGSFTVSISAPPTQAFGGGRRSLAFDAPRLNPVFSGKPAAP